MENWTSIFLFLAGIAVSFLGAVSKYLFDKVQNHEKRIQKVEDVQGNEIKQLRKEILDVKEDIHELKEEINEKMDTISKHIHKENNIENQMNVTLKLLLKHLEDSDK